VSWTSSVVSDTAGVAVGSGTGTAWDSAALRAFLVTGFSAADGVLFGLAEGAALGVVVFLAGATFLLGLEVVLVTFFALVAALVVGLALAATFLAAVFLGMSLGVDFLTTFLTFFADLTVFLAIAFLTTLEGFLVDLRVAFALVVRGVFFGIVLTDLSVIPSNAVTNRTDLSIIHSAY